MDEWQIDEHGRRYRRIGSHAIEYEMLVQVDGCQVPASELHEFVERKREAERARLEAEKSAPPPPPRQNCPFADDTACNSACTREGCALFVGETCNFARYTPAKDSTGLRCPFDRYGRACRKDCALYDGGGCALTGIVKINQISESEAK